MKNFCNLLILLFFNFGYTQSIPTLPEKIDPKPKVNKIISKNERENIYRNKKLSNQKKIDKDDFFEFIRRKAVQYSTKDGKNGNSDLEYYPLVNRLKIIYEDSRADIIFLDKLDANGIYWDTFNPENGYPLLLRLNITSIPARDARECYNQDGSSDTSKVKNVARFLFKYETIEDINKFKKSMEHAVSKLIELNLGKKREKEKF